MDLMLKVVGLPEPIVAGLALTVIPAWGTVMFTARVALVALGLSQENVIVSVVDEVTVELTLRLKVFPEVLVTVTALVLLFALIVPVPEDRLAVIDAAVPPFVRARL